MRVVLVISIGMLCVVSCIKEKPAVQRSAGVPFQISSNWSAAEQSAFDQLPTDLRVGLAWARAWPIYRATWQHGTNSLHICLQYPGAELGGTPYSVFVFDDAGRLVEQSKITAPQDWVPRQVVGILPLRIAFGWAGYQTVRELDLSTEEWRRIVMAARTNR